MCRVQSLLPRLSGGRLHHHGVSFEGRIENELDRLSGPTQSRRNEAHPPSSVIPFPIFRHQMSPNFALTTHLTVCQYSRMKNARLTASFLLCSLQSQRDCALQPWVGELASLPWVGGQVGLNSEGVPP